jgi:hypothetical protein
MAECVIPLANGRELRCPAYPLECSYVRIVGASGKEIAYWASEEWAEDAEVVMGAILGAAKGGRLTK